MNTPKPKIKPKTSAECQAESRRRWKAAGFVRRDLIVHPDDWFEVSEFARSLRLKRGQQK